ncbi:MAG: TIGR04086 family membrane protein [Sedimenticola sp.]
MNWKAVLLGTASYPLLWLIWLFLSPGYAHTASEWHALVYNVFLFVMPFFPGFLAGYIARERGLLHGAVVGVVISLLILTLWTALDMLDSTILLSVAGALALSSAGGALSQWGESEKPGKEA